MVYSQQSRLAVALKHGFGSRPGTLQKDAHLKLAKRSALFFPNFFVRALRTHTGEKHACRFRVGPRAFKTFSRRISVSENPREQRGTATTMGTARSTYAQLRSTADSDDERMNEAENK